MVDLQQRGIFERPCNLHISLWIFDTLLPFFGRDNGLDGKGLFRKLILLDPSLPLFLFFFLFYYTSLYRCFFMAVLFIGNFIGKNAEPMPRIPFLSILRKRDIFLLRHSLGKLRISFLLLLLFFFFHFACSNRTLSSRNTHTHIQIFLDPNSSCFWACFIFFVFLADVSCKFSSITVPTSVSQ